MGNLLPDQPGRISSVDAIHEIAEIERARAERITRVAAGDICWKGWISRRISDVGVQTGFSRFWLT